MKLFSRHNQVRIAEHNGMPAVRKHFDAIEDWRTEYELIKRLENVLPVPKILQKIPGTLLMEKLPGITLLDELERQERERFSPLPWQRLCDWLLQMYRLTGLVPGDGNLRNFLWSDTLYGIDFEHYRAGTLADAGCEIAAFLLEYHPADTPEKLAAARIFSDRLSLTSDGISCARQKLTDRRRNKASDSTLPISFILLAGGRSRRMGSDKAKLSLCGVSFLEHQIEKARMLGIRDILISGSGNDFEDARFIADVFPDRGPLGGIYSCLREAANEHCLVLGVDTPLIPASELRSMTRQHLLQGMPLTLASHGDRIEPLIGIYSTALANAIEPMLKDGGPPVRAVMQKTPWQAYRSVLPEPLWTNCNTPDAYHALTET